MTIALRSDANGTQGAVQVNGVDQLILNTSGVLQAAQAGGTAAQFDASLALATTAFVRKAAGSTSGSLNLTGSNTLTAAHVGKFVAWDGNGTLTLPAVNAVPAGSVITVFKYATNSGTFASAAGTQLKLPGQAAAASLVPGTLVGISVFYNDAQTSWDIGGDFTLKTNPQFAALLGSNGWQKLPSGLIIQWGSIGGVPAGGGSNVTFLLAFPNAVLNTSATIQNSGGVSGAMAAGTGLQSTNGMTVFNNGNTGATAVMWMAIGY